MFRWLLRCLRSVVRATLWLVAGMIVLFAGYFAYGAYAEPRAERAARDFCATVAAGERATSVIARAEQSGASSRYLGYWSNGLPQLDVVFEGTPPFSRHSCTIDVSSDAMATGARYSHLD